MPSPTRMMYLVLLISFFQIPHSGLPLFHPDHHGFVGEDFKPVHKPEGFRDIVLPGFVSHHDDRHGTFLPSSLLDNGGNTDIMFAKDA